MTTVVTLLLAHLIGDFPLQTNKVFKLKNEGNLGLALHVVIHLVVAAILIGQPLQYWTVLAVLGVAHFTTDWIKLKYPGKSQAAGFVWDQLIHYITILLIGWWMPDVPALLSTWIMIPAIILAFIPAIMLFFWVWANQIQRVEPNKEHLCVNWASQSLLPLSQRLGLVVVLALVVTGSTVFLL